MSYSLTWRVVKFPDGYRILCETNGYGTDELLVASQPFKAANIAEAALDNTFKNLVDEIRIKPDNPFAGTIGQWDIEVDI